MIIPKLYGRAGNQCFQISAAIAHAKRMKTTWAIPRRTEDARYWPNYFLNEVPLNNRSHHFTLIQHNELRHCFDALPDKNDLTLNGYFQSEKYWPTHEEKCAIGDALGFHCKQQDYIAIHVRRGDYVTQFSDKHPPLDFDYYRQAIDFFNDDDQYSNVGRKLIFCVYTDDIEWCKENFIHKNVVIPMRSDNFPTIEFSPIKDPIAAMRDMYNAAGFIIANSTFSLFPALLRLDNPVVIAPAENRWYGPGNGHLETFDLMPERFIKI